VELGHRVGKGVGAGAAFAELGSHGGGRLLLLLES
jgi:hypothetical protein